MERPFSSMLWSVIPDERMADRGPRYTETPADPLAPGAPNIAEPWNAVTASFFILIVLYWFWRVRGRLGQFPFLAGSLVVLLVGGIGGTMYHATRSSIVYFLMDVIPISLLGLAASLYLTIRLGRKYGAGRVLLVSFGVVGAYLLVNGVVFRMITFTIPALRISLSYTTMATVIMIPILVTMFRTKFRHAGLIWAGLAAFVIAIFFRLVDPYAPFPIGTHWLWHSFGAVSTAFVIEYFYRVEKGAIPLVETSPPAVAEEAESLAK